MAELAIKPRTYRVNRSSVEEPQSFTADGVRWRILARPMVWRPPTDVYETDDNVVIRVEIAGMREEDFIISLEEQFVIIRGTRLDIAERRAYHQLEIPFGEFSTELELPCPIAADLVKAIYQDGLLRITLPKARPHQVRVEP